jgi:hypothetical protein
MIWNASAPSSTSANALSLLYSQLISSYRDITHEMYKFDHYLEHLLYPLSSEINHSSLFPSIIFLQDLFPNMFIDFQQSLTMINDDNLTFPHPVSIICFPLSPKPHEVYETTPWIKQWWQEDPNMESAS